MSSERVEQSWSTMPVEIQAKIVGNVDVWTRNCGSHEADLVAKFSRNNVKVFVRYNKIMGGTMPQFKIELRDEKTNSILLTWNFIPHQKEDVLVMYTEAQPIIIKGNTMLAVVSKILRRLFTERIFVVKVLELQLDDFEGELDFESISFNFDVLIVNNCYNTNPVYSILSNKNLEIRKVFGVTKNDVFLLWQVQTHMYAEIIPQFTPILITWISYYTNFLLKPSEVESIEDYQSKIGKLLDDIPLFHDLLERQSVKDEVFSEPVIFTIMYLQAAYTLNSDPLAAYLKSVHPAHVANMVSLQSGLEGINLNPQQLSTLFVVYLVRLLRNEPEIQEIYENVCNCLRRTLDENKELNYYEKLTVKIESLFPPE